MAGYPFLDEQARRRRVGQENSGLVDPSGGPCCGDYTSPGPFNPGFNEPVEVCVPGAFTTTLVDVVNDGLDYGTLAQPGAWLLGQTKLPGPNDKLHPDQYACDFDVETDVIDPLRPSDLSSVRPGLSPGHVAFRSPDPMADDEDTSQHSRVARLDEPYAWSILLVNPEWTHPSLNLPPSPRFGKKILADCGRLEPPWDSCQLLPSPPSHDMDVQYDDQSVRFSTEDADVDSPDFWSSHMQIDEPEDLASRGGKTKPDYGPSTLTRVTKAKEEAVSGMNDVVENHALACGPEWEVPSPAAAIRDAPAPRGRAYTMFTDEHDEVMEDCDSRSHDAAADDMDVTMSGALP
ncbi:hypothetical protein GGR53DRAFT_462529 [Hypoxylon sp. FL1150]|nr:hypothetical protein GGR53DRAFT_462529 [Hypoxylon sp. FL1150]